MPSSIVAGAIENFVIAAIVSQKILSPKLVAGVSMAFRGSVYVYLCVQESRAVAGKPRDAATVVFGLKFADNIHYKFKNSHPMQVVDFGTKARMRLPIGHQ